MSGCRSITCTGWLAELVDWIFLYHETHSLDNHTDQPSLDPGVFFKPVSQAD